MKKIKLTMLYTFWTGDDLEMLIKSIKHHKNHVESFLICFQSTSNKCEFGGFMPLTFVNELSDINVDLMFFEPDLTKNTKENERIKHNKMIQFAKKNNATHFILSAADHFYSDEMFKNAINEIKISNVDVILTKMRTYYKQENWILYPLEDYYMPFIHKMYPNTKISKTTMYPVVVDPSVKVNTSINFRIWTENLFMDHYSMVRKDINKKFRNAASSIRWKPEQIKTFISEYENAKVGDSITYFQGRKIIEI